MTKCYNVGVIHPTKHHGDIQIIQRIDKLKRLVRFLNTGNEKVVATSNIAKGYVCDPGSLPKPSQDPIFKAGDTFTSRKSGDFVVVDYDGSRRVTIRFVNTGNEYVRRAARIAGGSVYDSKGAKTQ